MHFSELPIPEEMKQAIEQEISQRQMAVTSFQHDVQRLFEELDKDHLLTLRHLFDHLARAEDARYAAYLEGVSAATLRHRFNVCGSCGVDHDQELLAPEDKGSPDLETSTKVDGGTQHSLFGKEAQAVLSAAEQHEIFLRRAEKYGVKMRDDADYIPLSPNQTPVVCVNCGTKYVSLDDRMIATPGPEGCEGCIHKAKWG